MVGLRCKGDGFAIDWAGSSVECARAYIRSFAQLLAVDLDIDFLKIDAVAPGSAAGNATSWPVPPYNSYDNSRYVSEFSAALEATGKPVWLAISWEIDPDFAGEFVPAANSWRTSMDIDCYCEVLVRWPAVKRVFAQAAPWVPHTGPPGGRGSGRPDFDSLNLGNEQLPWGDGLSALEAVTYATFWAISGAGVQLRIFPLFLMNQ